MNSNPLEYGPVRVTWKRDRKVNSVMYDGEPLLQVTNNAVRSLSLEPARGVVLPSGLAEVIDNLLNALASLGSGDRDRKLHLANNIFENLVIRATIPNPKIEGMFWRAVLQHVWQWEETHERIHKGTPYYFMAEKYLGSGDVPSAYICFFNAIEEDKRNYPDISEDYKEGPAYRTTSLVDNSQNYLYDAVVVPLRSYLESFLSGYRSRTGSGLRISSIDQRFLQADPLENIKRFFVANFHEIYHLNSLNSTQMINNDYSKLKVIDTLFNLGLVIDQILEYRFLLSARREEKKMGNAVYQLALQQQWTSTRENTNAGEFLGKVSPHPNSGDPNSNLPSYLNGTCAYNGRVIGDRNMLAILAALHLRNYGGHHLDGSDILVNRYSDVLDMTMDAFFESIEVLM